MPAIKSSRPFLSPETDLQYLRTESLHKYHMVLAPAANKLILSTTVPALVGQAVAAVAGLAYLDARLNVRQDIDFLLSRSSALAGLMKAGKNQLSVSFHLQCFHDSSIWLELAVSACSNICSAAIVKLGHTPFDVETAPTKKRNTRT